MSVRGVCGVKECVHALLYIAWCMCACVKGVWGEGVCGCLLPNV